jgi:hypothetical protein
MLQVIKSAPVIAAGTGHELPDRFALKVTDQWLARINEHWIACDNTTADLLAMRGKGGFPANVKGQMKTFAIMKRGLGDLLLASFLQAGNRARYHCFLDTLEVIVEENGTPRLYCTRQHLKRDGVNHELQTSDEGIFCMSRHALSRLVQRGGIESVDDLREAMRAAWPALALVEAVTRSRRFVDKTLSWIVPVRLPKSEGFVALACTTADDNTQPLIIKTVLTDDMLDGYKFSRCEQFMDAVEPINPLDGFDSSLVQSLLSPLQTGGAR